MCTLENGCWDPAQFTLSLRDDCSAARGVTAHGKRDTSIRTGRLGLRGCKAAGDEGQHLRHHSSSHLHPRPPLTCSHPVLTLSASSLHSASSRRHRPIPVHLLPSTLHLHDSLLTSLPLSSFPAPPSSYRRVHGVSSAALVLSASPLVLTPSSLLLPLLVLTPSPLLLPPQLLTPSTLLLSPLVLTPNHLFSTCITAPGAHALLSLCPSGV